MAITLNGTTGVTTPGVTNSGSETIASNLSVTGSVTVVGTIESTSGGFKFPDGTTQSTAATVSSSAVATATAALTAGSLGTYVLAGQYSGSATAANGTIAGSSLQYTAVSSGTNSGALSGTWRAMGRTVSTSDNDNKTVWLRIA